MTLEQRPETPAEGDRRKAAAYDFDPECEVGSCEQRASQTVRCKQCNSVRFLLCGAHAGHRQRKSQYSPTRTKCGDCGVEGSTSALLDFRPLWDGRD